MMTSTSDSCKDGASKSNDDGVCEVNDMLHNMSTADNCDKEGSDVNTEKDIVVSAVCANCGKEGGDNLKACSACNLVKYCNRDCQIAHRPQHKKECKKRSAELYDEQLFKEHTPRECPLCMLPLPLDNKTTSFMTCCGKSICCGWFTMISKECDEAFSEGRQQKKDFCPYCRALPPNSDEDIVKRIKKLMENGNAVAYHEQANNYAFGNYSTTQDYQKANELYLKAGELGYAAGYLALGTSHAHGSGVEVDKKKAKHYYELAVMNGSVQATYELAALEHRQAITNEHYERAKKLYTIAAMAGHEESLQLVKKGFMTGVYTKDEYADTLRAYQKRQDEMKSTERDNADAFHRHLDNLDAQSRPAELHDEKLFKQPPPLKDDCPICFLLLPSLLTGRIYMPCCGKEICSGCAYAPVFDNQGNKVDNQKCEFCRTQISRSDEEHIKRERERVKVNDPIAICKQGSYYEKGLHGFTQNHVKALELWHRAAELGYAEAYNSIGYAYEYGRGVEVDEEKAKHYYQLAAIAGDPVARHNLGVSEARAGNLDRALKHLMIAAGGGKGDSLKNVQLLYANGRATKEDYTNALQSYQTYLGEIKSRQRDEAVSLQINEAAATYEDCRYY